MGNNCCCCGSRRSSPAEVFSGKVVNDVIIRHPLTDRYAPDQTLQTHQSLQTQIPSDVTNRSRQTPTRPIATIKGRVVVAMYNYEARDSQDVSFRKGDRMEVVDDSEKDWLNVVHLITKEMGYIPGNFVAAELSVESEELTRKMAASSTL